MSGFKKKKNPAGPCNHAPDWPTATHVTHSTGGTALRPITTRCQGRADYWRAKCRFCGMGFRFNVTPAPVQAPAHEVGL